MNTESKSVVASIAQYQIPGKQLDKAIKQISNVANVLDDKLHVTAVASYAHALPPSLGGHGDCSYVTKLLNAARHSKALRNGQLMQWFKDSGPFAISEAEDGTVSVRYKAKYDLNTFLPVNVLVTRPFYQVAERVTYSFELVDSLEKMLKTGRRQLKHIAENSALDVQLQDILKNALKEIEKVKNYAVQQAAK